MLSDYTVILLAIVPNLSASSREYPLRRRAQMAPVRVSPAPVVFMTQLLFTGFNYLKSPFEEMILMFSSPLVMMVLIDVYLLFLRSLPTL